jgi:hypothetical protein
LATIEVILATTKVGLVTIEANFVVIKVCWDVTLKGWLPCVDMYLPYFSSLFIAFSIEDTNIYSSRNFVF